MAIERWKRDRYRWVAVDRWKIDRYRWVAMDRWKRDRYRWVAIWTGGREIDTEGWLWTGGTNAKEFYQTPAHGNSKSKRRHSNGSRQTEAQKNENVRKEVGTK